MCPRPIPYSIGAGRVAVPNRFFKVIYSPAKQQMVAFVFSNTDLPEAVKDAACSVDDVEAITGMDFFAALPDELENKLESLPAIVRTVFICLFILKIPFYLERRKLLLCCSYKNIL